MKMLQWAIATGALKKHLRQPLMRGEGGSGSANEGGGGDKIITLVQI